MHQAVKVVSLATAAWFVAAAQSPSWQTKPVERWDRDDANIVLNHSPWAERVTPQWVRDLSPDERRNGGDMQADIGKGVGLEGLAGIFDPERAAEAISRAHAKPDPGTVLVRWESARPIQTAEKKVGDLDAPTVESDEYYAITVYDIPTPKEWTERTLRGVAFLKRYQKKDLKPARVDLLRKDGGLATVVYLFPRSVEIGKRDGNVVFQAQIGRLVVTRVFEPADMQIAGVLEL